MKNYKAFKVGVLISLVSGVFMVASAAKSPADKWKDLLVNRVLSQKLNSSGAVVMTSDTKAKAGESTILTQLHLCKDGSFVHVEKMNAGAASLNVAGVKMNAPESEMVTKITGKWKMTKATSANVKIVLIPAEDQDDDLDEEDSNLLISFDGSHTIVNDTRWARMKSNACR